MGPKQSSQAKKEGSIQEATISHPRFEKAKLLSDNQDEYLQISIPVVNETQITNWSKSYKPYLTWDSLLLPRSYSFKGTQLCGSNGLCTITYDNYPFLLKDEINDRSQEKKYFENSQLWYLAFTIFEAANAFHSASKKVGDIRPLNVFINDNGQTKIASHLTWPQEFTNYEKAIYDKQLTYLAPEQIVDLNFGHIQPRGNAELAECFSVGLTLLDSVLLSDSKDLYNYGNFRFDYQKLEGRIHKLFQLQGIDHHLKLLIAGLCKPEPTQRLKCRDLHQWLLAYKESIINIEPFQITQLPSFLQSITVNRRTPFIQTNQRPTYIESQVASSNPEPVIAKRYVQYVNAPPPIQVRTDYPRPGAQIVIENPRKIESVPHQQSTLGDEKRAERKVQSTSLIVNQGKPTGQITSNANISNNDDFRLTLQKIEEQLALSRRMFPS